MPSDAEHDVFLCHNSRDKPAVKKIAHQLRERGLRPWLDEWEPRFSIYFLHISLCVQVCPGSGPPRASRWQPLARSAS